MNLPSANKNKTDHAYCGLHACTFYWSVIGQLIVSWVKFIGVINWAVSVMLNKY